MGLLLFWPAAAAPSTFGDTTPGASFLNATGDEGQASKFTMPEAGTITKIWIYNIDAVGGNGGGAAKPVIYSDDLDTPKNRLAVGSAATLNQSAVVPAWTSLDINYAAAANEVLWLGLFFSGTTNDVYVDTTPSNHSYMAPSGIGGANYANPPALWVESSAAGAQLNIYAEYTPGGGGGSKFFLLF